ncbi:MAG TPA: PfkB family carbohydrate kinase [Solirubrobacteraceae bacterium]|nr:PfkB family carbohydrate kinase [Solirubrobacteraceae bacterium]
MRTTLGARPGLTVIGNLAVDSVNGGEPSAGGCPSFAAAAFAALEVPGRIVTKHAPADAALFAPTLAAEGVPTTVLNAAVSSGFALDYEGEQRAMTVTAVGEPWTPGQLRRARLDTTWVHLAALLRGEFPLATIAALRAAGHLVSLDGQGLVRLARVGPMVTDADFDPAILAHLAVLKLADDEAEVVAGGRFTEATARRLGVPEILVTFGSAGADVYLDGRRTAVPAPERIDGVHTTGSGDMFIVTYAAARSAGAGPLQAAAQACELVAGVLSRRRAGAAI